MSSCANTPGTVNVVAELRQIDRRDRHHARPPRRRPRSAGPPIRARSLRRTPCRDGRARGLRRTDDRGAVRETAARAVTTYRCRINVCPTAPASHRACPALRHTARRQPGRTTSGAVPPWRFSPVTPAVAKNERPLPSLPEQARPDDPARVAGQVRPRVAVDVRAAPANGRRRAASGPSALTAGRHSKPTASVAPRVDRLTSSSRCASAPGRREIRLTTPPMAPAP